MIRFPGQPPRRRHGWNRCLPLLAMASIAACGGAPARASDAWQVFLLYDERTDLPGLTALDAGLVGELVAGSPRPVQVYRESMDLSRFDSASYRETFASFLQDKYAGRKIDVAIAVMGPALDFLLERGEALFPGTPIVFCGLDRRELGARDLPANVTGVLVKREFAPTLEIALALHPEAKQIAVVAGTSDFDRRILEQARAELQGFAGRVQLSYLSDQPFPRLLETLSRPPPGTIVLFLTFFRDAAGNPFVPHDALERLAAVSGAPVYGFVDQYLGRGIVGGRLYSLKSHGEEAARRALGILGGVSPAELPVAELGASVPMFDSRALRRWHLSENRLPPGSVVRYREPSLWRDNRREVLLAVAAIALLAALLAILLFQYARRRWAEAGLRESEHKFRTLADTTPVLLWLSDAEGRLSFVNRSWLEYIGGSPEQQIGEPWIEPVHPEDRSELARLTGQSAAERGEISVECRLKRYDGAYSPFLVTKSPRFDVAGKYLGVVGSCVDLSAQKAATHEMQRTRVELARVARVATVGELTASVAHELRQPLAAILANAEAGVLLLDSKSPPLLEVREILEDIRTDDRRAGEIIGRIRSLLEKHELVRAPLDVNETTAEVLRLLKIEAAERKVALRFEPADDLPAVAGDRVHLQQVVVNLVLNAAESMTATPSAERWIAVRTCRPREGWVEIQVADSGPGIPAEHVELLFEPFWTTKKTGLGMGLSIARSIVESHDGRIWVESEAGGGALFHVALPALERGAE
jgi:PAS domain S-box-containing protein